MNLRENINQLRRLFKEEIYLYGKERVHSAKIEKLIREINSDLLGNYAIQREYISDLLFVYQESEDHCLSLMLSVFLNNLEELKKSHTKPLDLTFWEGEFDYFKISNEFLELVEEMLSKIQLVRLSQKIVIDIAPKKASLFLRLIHKEIASQSLGKKEDRDTAYNTTILLWMARNICNTINRTEIFYFLVSVYMDTLFLNQNYQFARDMAEECIICSYDDKREEYGYYLSFKVYASTSSASTALHYGIFATMIFKSKPEIIDFVLKNFYWETMKFLRNIKLIPLAISLFEKRPLHVSYSEYENNKFHHTYYSMLFYTKDKRLPELVLSYIDKIKEDIIRIGEREATPWLAMLFNVQANYSDDEYDLEQFDRYVELFKRVIHPMMYEKIHKSLFGNLDELKIELEKTLLNLSFTRSESDFTTDNKVGLQLSHRNILKSFKKENVEGYLLSMILQSDFTLIFRDKAAKSISAIDESYSAKKFKDEYYEPSFLKKFVDKTNYANILWLGTNNHTILPLYFVNGKYQFLNDKERPLIDVVLYATDAIKHLPLSTKKKNQDKLFEDYAEEEARLKTQINFFDFSINVQQTLLVIKDIEISMFPHNLLIAENDFICNQVPMSNIMSLEWFMENKGEKLSRQFTKSIWIPIESRDFPISMMYDKMQENIKIFGISETINVNPNNPLESEVNIVVAHGSDEISSFPAFYLETNIDTISIHSFNHIVGQGKILVLFVCHSGSEKSDLFRNRTITLVKHFLERGYKAVVAPFWGLHIDIPPIWLPEFLKQLESGKNIGEAVFESNRKVSKTYNTPNAYACLHMYGDPFIKIQI